MNKAWQDEVWRDYLYWQKQDKKTLKKINQLLKDIDSRSELKGFALLKIICKIEQKLQKEVDGLEKYEIITDSPIDREIKKRGVVVYEK